MRFPHPHLRGNAAQRYSQCSPPVAATRALLVACLLLIGGWIGAPRPVAAQNAFTCVNKTTTNGVGYANYSVYASGSTLYVGSASYAIFTGKLSISTDGGTNFTERSTATGLGSTSVRGITGDGGTVYVATANGLSISTDGGATFTNKTTTNGLGNNAVWGVYATGSNVYAGTSGGVSISTDGGATFTNRTTANGLGTNAVWGGVYAVGNTVYAATNSGLAISTDGGVSFTNKTTADGLGNNNVRGVYASGNTAYAATDGGLSISTDGGASFTNKTTANGLGNNVVSGVYVSENTIYAATNGGLSISTDGGATFTNYTTTNGLVGNTVASVYASGSTVYAGIFGGLSICTLPAPPVSQVQGNGVTIASGDTTPSTADGTDFGSATIGSSLVQAFTISNTGAADLTSVAVTLSGDSAFSVSSAPAATISPGNSSTFTVTFSPTANGVVTTTVNFASNQDPYTFVVGGTGTTPGAALDFDGVNDYVTLPATLNNQFGANRITLEGWFYPTAPAPANQYVMWIGEAYTSDSNVKFTIYQESANLICGFYDNGWIATNGVAVTLNQWQHVACTYDQQNIKLYVNGAVVATAAATAALPAGDGDWYLGRRWDADELYTGRIDEVRIWNRALSAGEIANSMNCEPSGTASGLVARYGFNQGTALADNSSITSLTDSSSDANNGTLTNFALSGSTSNWVAPGSAASGVACVAAPEIDVQGNDISIANGDSTPSTTDDTDFGRQTTSGTVTHTFTINNSGAAALTGVAVTVNGDSAFSLASAPASSVAAGGDSSFTIEFTPGAVGAYTATVSIGSNDSDENGYTFVVLGVWTGSNVALEQPATQSSTYDDPCTGPARKAVDGNTSGQAGDCSFSTTNSDPQDWWQVDLGASYLIQVIDIWNRTDCCGERLRNFDLLISTDGANWTTFYYPATAPTTSSFVINRVVRYVKVQLRGTDYLTLAEVQVWGPARPEIAVQGNGVSIANGDDTPTTADQTDFSNRLPGSTATRTFTIRNQGAAALTLSGSPRVAISGDSAFSISHQPVGNSVAANSSVTFTLTFAPNAVGVVTATVSIANDDSNENPYTFVVSGVGMTANAQFNGVGCLLIDAINAANTDAASGTCPAGNGADTITLLQDVTLSDVDNADYANTGANGLPQISSAITIEGGGHTISRTASAPAFRFFFVPDGGVLTLNNLTLSNGDVTPDNRKGGALYNDYGGTATVNNSTLNGNRGFGGAIYNIGNLTVNHSTVSGNSAGGNGGGIENWGTLTVNDSMISSNSAGSFGGGIYNSGPLTVTNSTVSNNSAGGGGGFYNRRTLSIANSTVSGNHSGNGGGGLSNNEGGTVIVNNSTFSANSASGPAGNGSGLFNNSGTVTVNSSTFSANTAGNGGGGIANYSTMTVNNSTFSANVATGYGGGLFNAGTLTLNNSTFSGNNASGPGGGIRNNNGTLTLNRTLIAGNSTPVGPEIYIDGGTVNADSYNLIGYGGDTRSVGFTPGATDIIPGGVLTTVLTTTLADNGGSSTGSGAATWTHALVPGSLAVDAAGDSGLATDQRGVTRPQGAADDIGAFELAVVPPATITIVLDARPNQPTNLGFGGSLRGFILDDPTTDDGDAYHNSRTFTVAPGTYTVRRNNPATWYTTAIACTPSGTATVDLPNRSATLTVANGDNVTCTFTVDRAVRITARAFNDLVRTNTKLGQRNVGDPWLTGWTLTVYTGTTTVASSVTAVNGSVSQVSFANLRPGSYSVCVTLPANTWTPSTPAAIDPAYGQPCKTVTLTPGQAATLLFGAYQPTVVASEHSAPEDELITDEDTIVDLPYDPTEDETATEEEGVLRIFLPLVVQ